MIEIPGEQRRWTDAGNDADAAVADMVTEASGWVRAGPPDTLTWLPGKIVLSRCARRHGRSPLFPKNALIIV